MTRNEATLPPSQGNRLGCGRTRTSVQNLNRLVVARGKTLDQPQPAKGGILKLCCLKCRRNVLVKEVLTFWSVVMRYGYCTNCGELLFKQERR